jgi:prefoldin subunit 5
VRSVSQRLEGIEDGVDRLDERLAALQLSLDAITKELVELRTAAPRQTTPKPAAAKRTPRAR